MSKAASSKGCSAFACRAACRPRPPPTKRIWTRIKDALIDIRTWSSMLYLLLMLPLGIVYFVIAVVGVSLSLGMAGGQPATRSSPDHSQFPVQRRAVAGPHLLHTAPGLVAAMLFGILLFFLLLHVCKGIGWLHGRIAEALLVRL